jgi:hypothetical protein
VCIHFWGGRSVYIVERLLHLLAYGQANKPKKFFEIICANVLDTSGIIPSGVALWRLSIAPVNMDITYYHFILEPKWNFKYMKERKMKDEKLKTRDV